MRPGPGSKLSPVWRPAGPESGPGGGLLPRLDSQRPRENKTWHLIFEPPNLEVRTLQIDFKPCPDVVRSRLQVVKQSVYGDVFFPVCGCGRDRKTVYYGVVAESAPECVWQRAVPRRPTCRGSGVFLPRKDPCRPIRISLPAPPRCRATAQAGDAGGPCRAAVPSTPIEEELKDSYLTYAMSVIVSRALPDVRDGLKPSRGGFRWRWNDLNLGRAPRGSSAPKFRVIRAAITPPRRSVIYPTARPHGPGVETCGRADRQAGELRFNRRPPAPPRHAVHRSPMSPIAALMLGHQARHGRTTCQPTTNGIRNRRSCRRSSRTCSSTAPTASPWAWATSIPPHNLGRGLRRADPLDRPAQRVDR